MGLLRVELTAAALADIDRLAALRNSRKVKTDPRWTQMLTPLQANVVGLKGEFAMAVLSGLRVDRKARPRGDNGIDFTLPDGRTMDVKTVLDERSGLYYNSDEDFRADVAVLAVLDSPTVDCPVVQLAGWTSRDRFRRFRAMVPHKQGPCPTLAAGLLDPMGDLLAVIRGTGRPNISAFRGRTAAAPSRKR